MASISDNFNRANEALTAGPWAINLGTWTVTSNQALCNDAINKPLARHTTALDSADQRVTAKYIGGAGGLLARCSSDFQTGYFCVLYTGALHEVWRLAAGTRTFIAELTAITVNVNDTIYFEVEGSTLRYGVQGGSQASTTDTNVTTGAYAGMMSDNAINLDDFTAADLVQPAAPNLFVVRSNLQLR